MENTTRPEDRILSVDIGGSHIKATILNIQGVNLFDYEKIDTPARPEPEFILQGIIELTRNFDSYDKVSVGFPGYVRNGIVYTAPNLGTEKWQNTPFAKMIEDKLQKPVKLVNDADMQGCGVVKGEGLEMVITLGTGFGTALLLNGILLPHLELAHHPITKRKSYDDYVGQRALKNIGEVRWNKRLHSIIHTLKTVFNYDHLYIGGGNAKLVNFTLDKNISIVTNRDGIRGGARLWKNG